MMINSQFLLLSIVSIGLIGVLAQAAPYYYFFQDAPQPVASAQETVQRAASDAGQQVQQMAGQAQEAVGGAAQQAADQVGQAGGQISDRFHGHLSELYSHGKTAVRGAVDTVHPDFKNIGQDLTDAYQKTRTQVGKQIEPLAQTVRPYLDHAHKVVEPYVSQVREEMPKLIGQAKPALSKVGEHVRDSIQGVIKKMNGDEQQPAPAAAARGRAARSP